MKAICESLGLFWRWKAYALPSACKMEWNLRLNVEVSLTWEKYRLIFYKIYELLQFEFLWACFNAGRVECTTFCTHNAVKRAFKRRSISNGREISLNFLQNRRIIAIWVYLGLFRPWKTRALRSDRIMQWKEHLNVEISETGEQWLLIFDKIDELLQFEFIWACLVHGKRVHYVLDE